MVAHSVIICLHCVQNIGRALPRNQLLTTTNYSSICSTFRHKYKNSATSHCWRNVFCHMAAVAPDCARISPFRINHHSKQRWPRRRRACSRWRVLHCIPRNVESRHSARCLNDAVFTNREVAQRRRAGGRSGSNCQRAAAPVTGRPAADVDGASAPGEVHAGAAGFARSLPRPGGAQKCPPAFAVRRPGRGAQGGSGCGCDDRCRSRRRGDRAVLRL